MANARSRSLVRGIKRRKKKKKEGKENDRLEITKREALSFESRYRWQILSIVWNALILHRVIIFARGRDLECDRSEWIKRKSTYVAGDRYTDIIIRNRTRELFLTSPRLIVARRKRRTWLTSSKETGNGNCCSVCLVTVYDIKRPWLSVRIILIIVNFH